MNRHKDLSLRKPESTSLSRSMAFNKPVVDAFFNKYVSLLEKYQFTPDQIWNLDETGITTVMKPVKIVSTKGKKQVGQITSGERGVLVTFVGIINAMGTSLPPVFVFPRIRNPSEYLSEDSPTGAIALGNKSGWMTSELFPEVLKHIINHTRCSTDRKILLLLDNHESHISVEAIRYCKLNGIVLFSFPPHTTHRMQPLDVGIYAPFKTYLATAFNDWMLAHPGIPITVRHIGHLSNKAYENAFSLKNIKSSFKKTGLWPPDRLVFTENDFAASSVTDRPLVIENQSLPSASLENQISSPQDASQMKDQISSNSILNAPSTSTSNESDERHTRGLSLEEICPLPKAEMPKKKKNVRKSKSTVYTDTPELTIRENLELERRRKQKVSQKTDVKRDLFESHQAKPRKKQKTESSDSDDSFSVHSDGNSHLEDFEIASNEEFQIGDYVLVKFPTKTTVVHYIGQLEKIDSQVFIVKFMRRKGSGHSFHFPDVDDIAEVDLVDIVAKVHPPYQAGTSRTASNFTFNYNFNDLIIK